jgi:DNA repair photolyase
MLIYVPKGPAKEYAELALNYYKGCGHECKYCYVPGFFQMLNGKKSNLSTLDIVGPTKLSREKKIERFFKMLAREAKKLSGDPRRVLMCFTSDPYQPLEKELHMTRRCIETLGPNKVKMTILTKNPKLAMELDGDLIKKYEVELATTIVWSDDKKRQEWEPNTCSIDERIEALREAREAGLSTWVSIEPIIEPDEAISVVRRLINTVGKLKIGVVDPRWNAKEHKAVDWGELLKKILEILNDRMVYDKQPYYIKNGLWAYATDEIKKIHPKSN